jgi:hypothetical protein
MHVTRRVSARLGWADERSDFFSILLEEGEYNVYSRKIL